MTILTFLPFLFFVLSFYFATETETPFLRRWIFLVLVLAYTECGGNTFFDLLRIVC